MFLAVPIEFRALLTGPQIPLRRSCMFLHHRWGHFVTVALLGFAALVTPTEAQLPFSAPKNVSNNLDSTFMPQTAVDSKGYIFVVWEDDTSTNANILFSRSSDGGATFSAPSIFPTPGFSRLARESTSTRATASMSSGMTTLPAISTFSSLAPPTAA